MQNAGRIDTRSRVKGIAKVGVLNSRDATGIERSPISCCRKLDHAGNDRCGDQGMAGGHGKAVRERLEDG